MGVGCDFVELLTSGLVLMEHAYLKLLELKETSQTWYLGLLAYAAILLTVVTFHVLSFFPWVGMIYMSVTVVVFYPVLNYLDVPSALWRVAGDTFRPLLVQWCNSGTRRNRNVNQNHHVMKNELDIEEEDLMPQLNIKNQCILDEETYLQRSRGDDESQWFSDVNDRDNFLPSCVDDEMPSISQFSSVSNLGDSTMDPFDDFHAGLDFRDISVASSYVTGVNTSSANHLNLTHCAEEKIPDEKHARTATFGGSESDFVLLSGDESDQGFEVLDETHLADFTVEEIMEQNFGRHSHCDDVVY